MNPDTRMTISLLLSLAVSAPNLRMAAAGEADIVTVGLRYTIGFVIVFFAVGAMGNVFNQYLAALEERRLETARVASDERAGSATDDDASLS